jgi:DNA-binding YbaB/EbfC family protein
VVTGGSVLRCCECCECCDAASVGPAELVHPAAKVAAIAVATTAQTRTSTPNSLAQPPPDYAEPHPDSENEGVRVAQRGGQFGGGPNMQQLMKQAQKMQQQLEAAQAELAQTEVTGTAGGGLVQATVTGSGELLSLTIDPKAVDPDDVETLQDLVVAAVRDANRAASELAGEKMGPLTGGMGGLGLPGF